MRAGAWTVLVAALLGLGSAAPARTLVRIRGDALTIGIRVDNPPFGYTRQGDRHGLEYEIAKSISEGMGIKSFRITELTSQRQGEELLQSDRIDIMIGSVKASRELRDRFVLSNPYFRTGLGIMVMRSNQNVFMLGDLNGKAVSAVPESHADTLIETYISKARLEIARTSAEGLAMLQRGDVEALVHDRSTLQAEVVKNPALRLLDVSLTEDNYVILMNKGSTGLPEGVNAELEKLRASSPNEVSKLAALCAKYKLTFTAKPPQNNNPKPPLQPQPPNDRPLNTAVAPPPGGSGTLEDRVRMLEAQILELQRTVADLNSRVKR